jgi:FixJ family two-component response regulator
MMNTWLTNSKDDVAEDGASTVFVIDDDDSLRAALDSLLRSAGFLVQSFCSPDEFMKSHLSDDVPACIVLDVRFPGQSGLQLQSEINKIECPIPIVFLTGYADTKMTVKAMKAGAVDFLNKPFREQDLLDAIAQGINCHRMRRRAAETVRQLRARYAQLTPREREVFQYVAGGLLNKQIASELNISEYTVKIHRRNVMEKMAATHVVDLIHHASALGLSRPSPQSVCAVHRQIQVAA